MLLGYVMWWDQRDGQGIVRGDDGYKYYIDSSVVACEPTPGDRVTFEMNQAVPDVLCAHRVIPVRG